MLQKLLYRRDHRCHFGRQRVGKTRRVVEHRIHPPRCLEQGGRALQLYKPRIETFIQAAGIPAVERGKTVCIPRYDSPDNIGNSQFYGCSSGTCAIK